MTYPKVVLQARTSEIADLVDQCARGDLQFDALCQCIAAMGYRTTSLYEMVIAREAELKEGT